jgi:hypothetical protein
MAGSFIDPSDGVFLNYQGNTGELIRDPQTGELKVIVGSNQPIGGGPGGSTAQGAASTGPSAFQAFLNKQLYGVPHWTLGLFLVLVVLGLYRVKGPERGG